MGIDKNGDMFFWLLERPSKSVSSPTYFMGLTCSGLSIGVDYNRALKFETKMEAEAFAKRNQLIDWVACEHGWMSP